MENVTTLGPDTWKEITRAPKITWTQIAAHAPERGIAVSNHTGTTQLYAWDVPTGDLRPLSGTGSGRSFGLLSPDGCYVYYIRDDQGNETGHYVRVPFDGGPEEDLTPEMPPYSSSSIPFPLPVIAFSDSGNRLVFVFSKPIGYSLCAVDIAADGSFGPPRILLSGPALLRGPILSADGAIAVVCTNARTGRQQYDLTALDAVTGAVIGSFSDGDASSVESIAFAPRPGDRRLLCSSNRTGVKRPLLWDIATGTATELLASDAPDGEMVPLGWDAGGERILLCRFAGAVQQLYVFELANQTLTPLEHPAGSFTFYGCLGTYFGPDGDVYAQWSDAMTAPQLVALDSHTGAVKRSVLAAGVAPLGCAVRSVSFPSSDGQEVQAWLATPPGDGPFPTVVSVHGGPHGVTTEAYGMGAMWVGNGYAYLTVNYRGSTTFGREFQQKIWGDIGHWEIEDMIAARDYLVQNGIAHPEKLFVTGGSYGGYLTLLALGKTPELWAGGVAVVAIADQALSYAECSPLLQGITKALFGGTPAEKPELYAASSPLTYAAQVRVPVLVIQGRNDTRCPAGQMEAYEARMKSLGKDIDVIWFDAGHGSLSSAENIRQGEAALQFVRRVLSQ